MEDICGSPVCVSPSLEAQDQPIVANKPRGLVRRTSSKVICSPLPLDIAAAEAIPSTPDVVVLCLWPQATDSKINFYVKGYEALYPSTDILCIRSPSSTPFRPTSESRDIDPVLDDLTRTTEKSQTKSVQLHVFGQAGAAQACKLLRAFRIRTGQTLDVKGVVMDTEPSLLPSTLSAAVRSPQSIFLGIYILLMSLWSLLGSIINFHYLAQEAEQVHNDLNDPNLLPSTARKCYMFAHRNLMLSWQQGAKDDDEHEPQNYSVRRSSVDGHVRWSGDQERYWSCIEDVWVA